MRPAPVRTSPAEIYAGFWRRVGAAAVDLMLLWALTAAAAAFFLATKKFRAESELRVS